MQRSISVRGGAVALAVLSCLAWSLAVAPGSRGDLGSRQRALQQRISSDNGQISTYRGRLRDLQSRLAGIESSLEIQRRLLLRIQTELLASRARLSYLRIELTRDRRSLAAQLVGQYESPSPDLVGIVLESRGFSDLLERVDQMRRIARQNASTLK